MSAPEPGTCNEEPLAYEAAELRIESLRRERDRLNEALLAGEHQFTTAVAAEFSAGHIGWAELYRAYHVTRANGLPGHLTRWNEHIPHTPQAMAYQAKLDPGGEQMWSGHGMDVYLDPHRPPKGVYVTYILFDGEGGAVKVGTTRSFANHISHIRRTTAWVSWQAKRCRDENHAREVRRDVVRNLKDREQVASR